MSSVRVSVVVPSRNAGATIGRCLDALERQELEGGFEIIVVDSSDDGTAEAVGRRAPRVRLITAADRRFPGDARNLGVEQARGEIIAFTDADCIVDEGWLGAIARAHERYPDEAVIGGVVDNGNPESYVGWASYLCSFSQWSPQDEARRLALIPTCCLSMRRSTLDRHGRFRDGIFSSDTEYMRRLARAGVSPLLLPEIRVAHVNITDPVELLGKQVERGLHYARVRAEEMSLPRRLLYVIGAPALPLLLFARRARAVFAHGRYAGRFVAAAPLILAGMLGWSLGELLGYLGVGRGRR